MINADIQRGLTNLVGDQAIYPADQLPQFAVDGVSPQAAVVPPNVEQLQDILRFSSENKLVIVPWGGGVAMTSGNVPSKYDLAIVLTRINDVIEYEPADLTVGVHAGITLGDLQRRLANEGQFLPLDPPNADCATIGGILATAASGPLRYAYGAPRDLMIGIAVAQADGSIIHAGGRVVKNVTGYDLGKLYIGSIGTLGIIIEARFKVLPLPTADRTIIFRTETVAEAVTLSFALDRENLGLKALSLLNRLASRSIGLDAAAVILRITGEEAAVDSISTQVIRRAGELQAKPVETLGTPDDIWEAVRRGGIAERETTDLSLRASMLPTDVNGFIEALESAAPDVLPAITAIATYGTVTAGWSLPDAADALSIAESALTLAGRFGAQVWLEDAPAEVKQKLDVWGQLPESFPLMRRIKQQYDPEGRLNPGRHMGRL